MKKLKIYYQEENRVKTVVLNSSETSLFPKNIIKIKEFKSYDLKNIQIFETISKDEIYNLFFQLNIILNADILLSDAIVILKNSIKKPLLKKILESMENALLNGKPIYISLKEYEKYLDPIIIPFLKILENRGNSKLLFSSLLYLLKIKKDNRQKLLSAIRYPLIVFVSFFIALIMIFNFVVPKFETIFSQYEMALPLSTTILLGVKDFFLNYSLFLVFIIVTLFLVLKLAIKKVPKIHYFKDKFFAKYFPIISKIIQNYELYNFFLGLKILLQSKYEFHIALDNSTILIKNQYILDKIQKINEHLKNGKSIPFAFEQTEIFDDLIISLLNSGEKSNSLEVSIEKIESIYKDSFQNSIKSLSSYIEPIFFIAISSLILWIMLAVFTPIWNMSGMLS